MLALFSELKGQLIVCSVSEMSSSSMLNKHLDTPIICLVGVVFGGISLCRNIRRAI